MIHNHNIRIKNRLSLMTPLALNEQYPVKEEQARFIADSREAAVRILKGEDSRLLAIVGPCSIHDPSSALDYAERLKELRARLSGRIEIIMRVYFEKPRTIVGWKGLINDPELDGSYHVNEGLRKARSLLLQLAEMHLPAATEFLDATFGQYYSDLITVGAIGARTAESQIHRELASGLSMPIGIKNRTDGDVQVAADAINSASHPHIFPSLSLDGDPVIYQSSGNEDGFLILRGGSVTGPNYEADAVNAAMEVLERNKLPSRIVVDCSHGNSKKDPQNQHAVINSVLQQINNGNTALKGVMLESNIHAGNQPLDDLSKLQYGVSITDACVSFDETETILKEMYNSL